VDADIDGDAFFPALDPAEWIEKTRDTTLKPKEFLIFFIL
jgi:hypothetical protein